MSEKPSTVPKNYGFWLRYQSRSGCHNMYKEVRDVSVTGAVARMYMEMAGQYRVKYQNVQIVKVVELAASECKRPATKMFHSSSVQFPPAFPMVHLRRKTASPFCPRRPKIAL
eukprot:gnl/Chilomastix_cuspidata/127.p2 GENE.gnl/Chilomastix_cuspidata/127~~gnl/Chilomastix_cuspidata/127.p2  ORF type:complete len:113 (+),score=54.76 gnl/Chilomastix_cuspidata/127:216-554(+)